MLVPAAYLSEGINRQSVFTAVLLYDHLELREGEVAPMVRRLNRSAIRYSASRAVDGIVLDVLLNRAREIYRTMAMHIPVHEEHESITEIGDHLHLESRRVSYCDRICNYDGLVYG
jgi:hypothetical protein